MNKIILKFILLELIILVIGKNCIAQTVDKKLTYNLSYTGSFGSFFNRQVSSAKDEHSLNYIKLPFPWNYSNTLSLESNLGVSANIDFWRFGLGIEVLGKYNNLNIKCKGEQEFVEVLNNEKGISEWKQEYIFEPKQWREHYFYLNIPIYLKFNTFHGGCFCIGVSKDVLLGAKANGYFGDDKLNLLDLNANLTKSDKDSFEPVYVNYYSNNRFVNNLYLSIKSRPLNNFIIGLNYQRSLSEFRVSKTNETVFNTGEPLIISYYKSSFTLSASYRLFNSQIKNIR